MESKDGEKVESSSLSRQVHCQNAVSPVFFPFCSCFPRRALGSAADLESRGLRVNST